MRSRSDLCGAATVFVITTAGQIASIDLAPASDFSVSASKARSGTLCGRLGQVQGSQPDAAQCLLYLWSSAPNVPTFSLALSYVAGGGRAGARGGGRSRGRSRAEGGV